MTIYLAIGGEDEVIDAERMQNFLEVVINQIGDEFSKTLLIPSDTSRADSRSGDITQALYKLYQQRFSNKKDKTFEVLPALGQHLPLKQGEINKFYGSLDEAVFHVHSWRGGLHNFGDIPSDVVRKVSDGKLEYSIPVLTNSLLLEKRFGSIISIGQVVPHEVVGMANYTKNLIVGCGGLEMINKTHYLGAVCDMEKIMGRKDNPVRAVFDYAQDNYLEQLYVIYVLTVVGRDEEGKNVMRGLYVGNDREVFEQAAELSQKLNITLLDEPLQTAVVLNHYKSTWLGNKSIYRTRMAMADGGTLIVLAPDVEMFGEDPTIDNLIRTRGGYCGTEAVMRNYKTEEIATMGSAAAHQIHGSSEGRFKIVYCTDPSKLSKAKIRSIGFDWADVNEMKRKYDPKRLEEGFNQGNVFYISNPALGLWALRSQFKNN